MFPNMMLNLSQLISRIDLLDLVTAEKSYVFHFRCFYHVFKKLPQKSKTFAACGYCVPSII